MSLNNALRHAAHSLAAAVNAHRLLFYTVASTVAVSAAIGNALKNYSNFYSVAIYLSKSSRSVLVLANFGFLLTLLCSQVVQRVFFGQLRPSEVERLYDRLWFFITESLLAFTIFRDDFDIPFALMFGFLLFVKSFHWLAADRIEWMEQRPYPGPPPLFHIRMSTLFLILWATDAIMFLIAVKNTVVNGVGGMVLFASEYAILMASVANTISKYVLSTYELRRAGRLGGENAPPWENKSMWVFYIELGTDFLKLTTYLIFFTLIITFYGLPLNIVRDVYITARSFITRLRALHRYQTATRNMDQRYPNATEEEMTAMSDRTCIICREEMVLRDPTVEVPLGTDGPNTTPKKLPCGHVFHFHCLRSWLERQQSCPTCRRTVLDTNSQDPVPPAGGRAPLARPAGVVDPAPNMFGGANVQPGLRPNNNNPLGFVGRLFGGAQLPAAAPGAFPHPHGQFAQVPNNANANINPPYIGNLGWPPGQLPPAGILIQYHIQYQGPRQQLLQPQTTPQPLQATPPFAGFHGPDGVWRPWGIDPQWLENIPRNPTQPAFDPQEAAASTGTAPAQTQESPASPPTSGSDQSATPPSTLLSETTTNPREAAAAAALRRFNGTSSAGPRTPASGSSDAPAGTTTEAARPSAQTLPPASSSSETSRSRSHIPTMIPLYDYGSLISPANSASTSSGAHQQSIVPPPQAASGQSRSNVQRPSPQYETSDSSRRLPGPQIPLSELPPTLTDEQLSVMDRVTREAIDERLRVLEGVSGAIYRCIDDLMRMRSALPASTSILGSAHGPEHSSQNPSVTEVSNDSDGSNSDHPSSNEADMGISPATAHTVPGEQL